MSVRWTSDALGDMADIHAYISKDSIYYADRLLDSFYDRIHLLTGQPGIGRVVPEKNDISVREIFEGSYRIVYTTRYVPDIVILRIIHFSRQLKDLR